MPRANFDDSLRLPSQAERRAAEEADKEPPGPFAAGPVPNGDELAWIYVWIIQNGPGKRAAAAYGESPENGDPFSGDWAIDTEMTHDSDDFTPGRPALATAMALVTNGNRREIDWWSEAIMLHDPDAPAT
jgi:hypothetical protein